MKNVELVYYTAQGKGWVDMAIMSIHTLRVIGKYDGDVILFADAFTEDQQEKLNGFNVRCLIAPDEVKDKVHSASWRLAIASLINIDAYEYICYFDSDILITSDVGSIFTGLTQDVYYVPVHELPVKTDPSCRMLMSVEQLREWGDEPHYNNGQFIIHKGSIDKILTVGFNMVVGSVCSKSFGPDQSALNILLRTVPISKMILSRDVVQFMSLPYPSKSPIIKHYTSGSKGRMIKDYLNTVTSSD